MIRNLLDAMKRAEEMIRYIKSPIFHRPEWNIDGGMEMEFVMKRIRSTKCS